MQNPPSYSSLLELSMDDHSKDYARSSFLFQLARIMNHRSFKGLCKILLIPAPRKLITEIKIMQEAKKLAKLAKKESDYGNRLSNRCSRRVYCLPLLAVVAFLQLFPVQMVFRFCSFAVLFCCISSLFQRWGGSMRIIHKRTSPDLAIDHKIK
jgi:hypothetical protein